MAEPAENLATVETRATAEALEAAGVAPRTAQVLATRLHAAAVAGAPVTHAELDASFRIFRAEVDASLAALELKLVDRIAATEQRLVEMIVATEQRLVEMNAATERKVVANERSIANLRSEMLERIAESERRVEALLWRLFGGIVAVVGVAVAILRIMP